jgi:hypothetical protein
MTPIPFRLIPFAGDCEASDPGGLSIADNFTDSLTITGHLSFTEGTLEVAYQLRGDLAQLSLPSPASTPERRDLLWQTTCLELFLARRGADGYWEFNLSPAGHWNVYRLEGYRQGLAPEPAYHQLPLQVQPQEQSLAQHQAKSPAQQLTMTLRCPLPPDVRGNRVETAGETPGETGATAGGRPGLEVGITAVIEHSDGRLSYWALHHPAADADFHHRGGFTIQVP